MPFQCFQLFPFHVIFLLILFNNAFKTHCSSTDTVADFDLNSPRKGMKDLCINMDLKEFCLEYSKYSTRLNAHTIDDTFSDFLNYEVHRIKVPKVATEENFIGKLRGQLHLKAISFSIRSSNLVTAQNSSVRITPEDAYESPAIAELWQGNKGHLVTVLYKDIDHVNQLHLHQNKAFQKFEIGRAYLGNISVSLSKKLMARKPSAFLVHLSLSLSHCLIAFVQKTETRKELYERDITDYLLNALYSTESDDHDSMEGVFGKVTQQENLQKSWDEYVFGLSSMETKENIGPVDLTGDDGERTVKYWSGNPSTLNIGEPTSSNSFISLDVGSWVTSATVKLRVLAIRKMGIGVPLKDGFTESVNEKVDLAPECENPSGCANDILLVASQFVPFSANSELYSYNLSAHSYQNYVDMFQNAPQAQTFDMVVGNTTIWASNCLRSQGWVFSTRLKLTFSAIRKLRVGLPLKHGFKEFVNVEVDPATKSANASGFAVDIFLEALQFLLPSINYEFYYYNLSKNSNQSYDDMLQEMPEKFDMVVGDTTISASRANYVDFTPSYSEAGAVLVVKRVLFGMWIFTKPFSRDLWLAIILACIWLGIVLRLLEYRVLNNNEDLARPNRERLEMIYWAPIAVLAFPERNMVVNRWSIFVLAIWLFMAFILTQSYTAKLSAIFTDEPLKALSKGSYVGYQEGSPMKQFLETELHISESKLRSYSSAEEYHDAMCSGEIDAIFDEIPYVKLFLNKYASDYKIVGPIYKTNGFGIAFPPGSPLTANFSRAILNVIQGPHMRCIERSNLGSGYSSNQDLFSSPFSKEITSLTFYDFGGLFLLVGLVTMIALICSETSFGSKITAMAAQGQNYLHLIYLKFHSWWSNNNNGIDSELESAEPEPEPEPSHDTGATSLEIRNATVFGEAPIGGAKEISESGQNNESASAQDQEIELSTIDTEISS